MRTRLRIRSSVLTALVILFLLSLSGTASAENKTWYFPNGGGYTRSCPQPNGWPCGGTWPGVFGEADSFFFIFNPNAVTVSVSARCANQAFDPVDQTSTTVRTKTLTANAESRTTIWLGELISKQQIGDTKGYFACEFKSITSEKEIYVSRATYYLGGWNDNTGYPNATSVWDSSGGSVGLTQPSTMWYFAEGGSLNCFPNTRAFQNFYKIYNPNTFPITVNVKYNFITEENGAHPHIPNGTITVPVYVPPQNESDLWTNVIPELAGKSCIQPPPPSPSYNLDHSTILSSSAPFLATLSMYSTSNVSVWGPWESDITGVTAPSATLFWPEANNGDYDLCESLSEFHERFGIDTWWQPRYYFFNPQSTPSELRVTFYRPNGSVAREVVEVVPAFGRSGIDGQFDLNGDGLRAGPVLCGELAARVSATNPSLPVVATKVQYWPLDFAWPEGLGSTATNVSATTWMIPGGSTKEGWGGTKCGGQSGIGPCNVAPYNAGPYKFDQRFDSYFYVYNPGTSTTVVGVYYYGENGFLTSRTNVSIAPNGRALFRAREDLAAFSGGFLDFSAKVVATSGVIVETASFFNLQTTSPENEANPNHKKMWRAAEGGLAIPVLPQ